MDPLKSVLPPWAKTPVAGALRGYGLLTSGLRPLPEFLIIGAKRAGTTSLWWYLQQHPCVPRLFPPILNVKGVHFFDVNFHRGVGWYRGHFPSRSYRRSLGRKSGGRVLAGEASPYYLFHPLAARRASHVVPEARLIVLLRDPVDRAYSHYLERARHGAEQLSFEEAIEREPERLDSEAERILRDERYRSYAHEHWSYVSQGIYADPLRAWMDLYPRERIHVVVSERMFTEPEAVYQEILRFLGLGPWRLEEYRRYNFHPSEKLDPVLRARLDALFAPHNARLATLLDMELRW